MLSPTAAFVLGCSSGEGASAGLVADARVEAEPAMVEASSSTGLGGDATCDLPPDTVVHTFAPTYHAVYQEVLSPTCGLEFCHGGTADYLQLWSESEGYKSLVSTPAAGPTCSSTGLVRVDPGHPEKSLLYLKVAGSPPCGSRMPLEYGCAGGLDAREIDQIRAWIACGALDGDGGCEDAAADASSQADSTGDASSEQ